MVLVRSRRARSVTSQITWTDETWEPVLGCTRVSPGCENCYAERLIAVRMSKNPCTPRYHGLAQCNKAGEPRWTGAVTPQRDHLRMPLSWTKKKMIFVCSRSDLFHDKVPDAYLDEVFAVMLISSLHERSPGHVFQLLTKRIRRAMLYLNGDHLPTRISCAGAALMKNSGFWASVLWQHVASHGLTHPNIWLGTSVEDQERADERVPLLLNCPASVRWVSAEPLLGPLDLEQFLRYHPSHEHHQERRGVDLLGGSDLACRKAWMESVESNSSHRKVSTSAGRAERSAIGVSVGPGDGEWPSYVGHGAPSSVETWTRSAARRNDDQPQERGEVRQQAGQSGACDQVGEHQARSACSTRRESGESERRKKPCGEVDVGSSDGDSSASSQRRETVTACEGIPGCCADDLAHRAWRQKSLWLVCGGESGPGARSFEIKWARSIVAQCRKAGIPVFVKQLGARAEDPEHGVAGRLLELPLHVPGFSGAPARHRLRDRKGEDWDEWTGSLADLRVREYPA